MILGIDVGNTNVVLGILEDGKVLQTVRMRTESNATSAEHAIKISDLLHFMSVKPKDIEGSIISSVVPPATESIAEALWRLTGKKALVVGPGMKTGLNVRIDDPGTLGADLVVGAVAVIAFYSTPAIIVDMGTATTITVIDGRNAFRGGAILPGVKLSFSALVSGTSLLPDIYIEKPDKCIGTNTVDCMRSGAVLGTAAMIDGMIDRMEEELDEQCTLVATGGLASSIVPCCNHDIVCDDDLLLKGLWVLYQKNKK